MIKIIQTGYYHPSNANWSYGVYPIVDETGARFYKENFGGGTQLIERSEKEGKKVKMLYAGIGSNVKYKWSDAKKMPNIEKYTGKN